MKQFLRLFLIVSVVVATNLSRAGDHKHKPQPAMAEADGQTTTNPVPKKAGYWMRAHKRYVKIAGKGDVDLLFLGDSITDFWRRSEGKASWTKHFGAFKTANFGISGDRTQNMLWRLQNGELKGIHPKLVILMIGTNNLISRNSDEEIAEGINSIVRLLRAETPDAKLLLLGIFPRGEKAGDSFRARIKQINSIIAKNDDGKNIHYLDISKHFLDSNGILPKSVMPDGLHPNAKGYEIWAKAMDPLVKKIME